ncbi:hypothetical protein MACK_001759 [Theileria orientalis]|uniref:Uncharacterized protein n=1 Tax=Theileria orientalis TaxID=68886 RepID=A0A976MAY8_THEOR|nr:hypothetical protein MACK_001759 [Theileria orientalis]
MYKHRAFRSLLIYLLLCYGKKFVDADEFDKRKRISLSQEPLTGNSQGSNSRYELSHQPALTVTQTSQHCVDSNDHRINDPDFILIEAQNNYEVNNSRLSNDLKGTEYDSEEGVDMDDLEQIEVDTLSTSSRSSTEDFHGPILHNPGPSHDIGRSRSEVAESTSQTQRTSKNSVYFVSVDIGVKMSSPNIIYEMDNVNNIETYTPIGPYLIDMVKMGNQVLWTPNDNRYSNKVLIRRDERGKPLLRLYYPIQDEPVNESPSDLRVEDPRQKLEQPQPTIAPTTKFAPISEHLDALKLVREDDSIKLISVDVNNTFSTSEVIYKEEINGLQTLTCRPGYLIYKLLEGGEELWRHTEGEYPNRVIIGVNSRGSKVVDIRFPGDQILMEIDVTYTRSTNEIIYVVEPDGTESFICSPGYLICKISKGNKLIWEGTEPPYSDKVILYYDEKGKRRAYVQFYQEMVRPPQMAEEVQDLLKRRQEPIELVTVDINVKRSSSRIVHIRNVRRKRDIYTVIGPHLIGTVKRGDRILWMTQGEIYSDKVLVRVDENGKEILRVYHPKDYDRKYEHTREAIIRAIIEELEQADPPTLGPEEELSMQIVDSRSRDKIDGEDSMLLLYDKRGKPVLIVRYPPDEKIEIIPSVKAKPEVPKVPPEKDVKLPPLLMKPEPEVPEAIPEKVKKPITEPEAGEDQVQIIDGEKEQKIQPITLDIDSKVTTEEIGFLKQDESATYMPRGDNVINLIVSGKNEIWRSSGPKVYANKVIIDGMGLMGKTKNVTVHLSDRTIVHFKCTRKGWKKLDPEILLSINSKAIDHKFDYNIGFDDATFTPKSNFIFKGIRDDSNMNWLLACCRGGRKDIHTSQDSAEYSKKVIRDGISLMSRIKHVSMYMENGIYKHFYRKSRFYPWKELSNKISLDVNVKETCYRYEYKVYEVGTYTTKYDFLFKTIYQSSLLRMGSPAKVIWNAEKEQDCAIKVVIDGTGASSTPSNVTIYLLNGEIRHFSRPEAFGNWMQISTEVELDISKIESSLQIDLTYQGKYQFFVANHDFKITKVRDKDIVLWEGELPNYSKRAMLRGGKSQNKELTLYLQSGPKIFRKQGKKNPWVDATDESSIKIIDGSTSTDVKTIEQMKKMHEELLRTFTDKKVQIIVEGIEKGVERTYEVKKEGDDRIYELKDEYKCVEVRYGPKSLWKYDKEKHGKLYAKKVYYKKDKLLVIVDFDIAGLLFRYGAKQEMTLIYSRRPVPIEIDLEDSEKMDEIDFVDRTAYATYEPKQHYSINPLKCGEVKIHDSNDFFSYIMKVRAEPSRSPKRVYVELVNGKTKQYARSGERIWTEVG